MKRQLHPMYRSRLKHRGGFFVKNPAKGKANRQGRGSGEGGRPPSLPGVGEPQSAIVRWNLAKSVSGSLLLVALLSTQGCEKLEQRLFMRHSPQVDEAVTALKTQDAGVAAKALTEYLSTGRCKQGNIGTPESIRDYPNAAFDLGLTLFQLAERFGGKFGEQAHPGAAGLPPAGVLPPGAPTGSGPGAPPTPQAQALLARRSQEVDCALRLVRVLAADSKVEPELRAEAYYLSGNLEFLRGDYESAVNSYDDCLEWIPGGLAKDQNQVGQNAAWNRAIALKRIQEEEENKPPKPDAGTPPPSDGGGQQNDSDQDKNKDDKNQDQEDQNQDQEDQNKDQEQENQDNKDQGDQNDKNQDDSSKQDQQQQEQQDEQKQEQQQQAGQEQKQQEQQAQPQQPSPSLSQDERILQQLERAPMLQNELSKSRARGRVRLNMEDK